MTRASRCPITSSTSCEHDPPCARGEPGTRFDTNRHRPVESWLSLCRAQSEHRPLRTATQARASAFSSRRGRSRARRLALRDRCPGWHRSDRHVAGATITAAFPLRADPGIVASITGTPILETVPSRCSPRPSHDGALVHARLPGCDRATTGVAMIPRRYLGDWRFENYEGQFATLQRAARTPLAMGQTATHGGPRRRQLTLPHP